jgi:hypothetical protein
LPSAAVEVGAFVVVVELDELLEQAARPIPIPTTARPAAVGGSSVADRSGLLWAGVCIPPITPFTGPDPSWSAQATSVTSTPFQKATRSLISLAASLGSG